MRTRIAAVAATIALTIAACGGSPEPDLAAAWKEAASLSRTEVFCNEEDPYYAALGLLFYLPDETKDSLTDEQIEALIPEANALLDEECPR